MKIQKKYIEMFCAFLIIFFLLPQNPLIKADAPSSLLITEFYYHAHASLNNEFFTLTNPTTSPIDLTGWYLTDEPWKETSQQAKILFTDGLFLPQQTSWSITQNASSYYRETGRLPNYEYKFDSRPDVSQLDTYKTVTFSNTGGVFGLIDSELNTIDLIVYGDTEYAPTGWVGTSIPASGSGVILKRAIVDGFPVDTNTASDWFHPRIYHIGQSDFPAKTMSYTGTVTVFVSPDSSFETIVGELRNARTSIDLNMYEFTDPALCTELLAALERNVTIRIFMEGSPIGGIDDREKYILQEIASHGGLVRFIVSDTKNHVNARYQFDHAKYLILDKETVIVESCNWVKTGVPEDPSFGNREWGIVIRDKDIAAQYQQVFDDDWNPERIDSYSLDEMNLTLPPGFSLNDMIPTGRYEPQFHEKTISGSFTVIPIFSPDSSEQAILSALEAATTSIYVQQLYIYKDWDTTVSPFVKQLIAKAGQGVSVKVILNYNPGFTESLVLLNETKQYLEEYGIPVKVLSTTWAPFTAIHNKGMIIDNTTVLISSINWNEQSVRKNREAGVLLENTEVATYYADVFFSDWVLEESARSPIGFSWAEYKYFVLIAVVFTIAILLIIRDWRKRKW